MLIIPNVVFYIYMCVYIYIYIYKFWFAADYTGCLVLATEIFAVRRATDWTVPNAPNCTVLVP
jgi:hypothetical protein